MIFLAVVLVVSIVAGATAAIAGFGIGSLLTPLFALRLDTALAVAAVSVPHLLATALRAWRLRASIEWSVLRRFGLLSAAGGLAGALLYARLGAPMLTAILGALLVLTAVAALTEWTSHVRVHGPAVWALGLGSGFFGGVAGNQGGLRAAALLAFALSPAAFVATSTAVGLLVDAARMPLYAWRAGPSLGVAVPFMAVASVGVIVGTFLGERLLLGLDPARFRKVIAALIGLLGAWLIVRALRA